jgi:hypothetical protein
MYIPLVDRGVDHPVAAAGPELTREGLAGRIADRRIRMQARLTAIGVPEIVEGPDKIR